MLKEVVAVASTIIFSLGGAGAIIIGLSSWLVRIWANRILQDEKYKHENEMEKLRAQLKRDTYSKLEKLKHSHKEEIDVLMRTREVYQRLTISMRVFLMGTGQASELDRKKFLCAYDLCYLWASDKVVKKLSEFLDLIVENSTNPNPANQKRLKSLYAECLTEMRKDCGFSDTSIDSTSYKIVNF